MSLIQDYGHVTINQNHLKLDTFQTANCCIVKSQNTAHLSSVCCCNASKLTEQFVTHSSCVWAHQQTKTQGQKTKTKTNTQAIKIKTMKTES